MIKDELIQQIMCGPFHSFKIKESGELLAFGYNLYGQLGLGNYENKNIPTKNDKIKDVVLLNNITRISKWHISTHTEQHKNIKNEVMKILFTMKNVNEKLKKVNKEKKIPKYLVYEIISQVINEEPYQHEVKKEYQKGGNNELTPEDIKNIIANDTKLKNIFDNLTMDNYYS